MVASKFQIVFSYLRINNAYSYLAVVHRRELSLIQYDVAIGVGPISTKVIPTTIDLACKAHGCEAILD